MSRRLIVAAAVSLGLAACAESPVDELPEPCVDAGDARAFPLGAQCLHLTGARVLRSGAWTPIALADVVATPVSEGAITLATSAAAPAEAFELTLTGATGSALLQQGYQSWSFAGATRIPEEVPLADDGAILAAAAATGDPLDEVLGVSYGAALVGEPGGGSLAIGVTSSDVASTAIAVTRGSDGATVTALYGAARESLPESDGYVAMPALVLAERANGNEALAVVASEIERALPAGARTAQRPVGGWYSWNELFEEVDETAVLAHVDLVATKLAPKGLSLVEIDDGWEVAWGDWRANAKFPSGMSAVAKAITAKGLVAGIWLAPFLVDVTSEVAKTADPTLFVRDPNGAPIQHKPSGSSKHYFVLDGTSPASMDLVTKPIADLASAGFTFFKLDFLYAGAVPGVRADATATGTQALQAGLVRLRDAMGGDATLNACGAPIHPLLGHADSMRIGSDTAFAAVSLNWAAVAFAARSTAARSFLGQLVWLDGDQAQVRTPYSADEARAGAFVAALSGPAYALGDDLRSLPADRLSIALDPDVLDLAGADAPALPIDPLEGPTDTIYASPVLDAIMNPGSTGAPPPSVFTMRGHSGVDYRLTFDWIDAHSVSVGK